MTDFVIKIAKHNFSVSAKFESTYQYFADYVTSEMPDYSFEIADNDIDFERKKAAREDELEGIPYRKFSDAYLETIAVQRKVTQILLDHDVLLFHGSVIAVDGEAYLFTAKSGTGKSTHTRLWREMLGNRAVMVNDDKPFLEFAGEKVYAHGSPWNGKHHLGENICVPLKAICILERGDTNQIRQIAPADALMMLMQQSSRPASREKMPKYMDMIDQLTQRVAFYRLQCNMDPEAARVAWAGMRGKDD